jgi:predicted SnoaL-like aldol condensation-catalyzing enzyme
MSAMRKSRVGRAAFVLWLLAATSTVFVALPVPAFAEDAGQQLRAFIERLNEGTAKGDFDDAVGLQAEDGIRVHPIAGVIKGRKGLSDYFASVSKRWAGAHETITWLAADGNHVAAAITWEATNRESGQHMKLPMAFLAEFDANGMIKWSQIYFYLPPPKTAAK